MLSLGLGGSNHDFSACLVDGSGIVAGIEEERLGRVKYSVGVNSMFNESWRYCLDARGVSLDQVDTVVADDTLLPPAYFRFRSRVSLIRHHLAHAASTFFPSPFPQAAILIVDGAGSLLDRGVETLTTAVGDGTSITELVKVYGTNWSTDGQNLAKVYQAGDADHSLGYMYKAVSKEIGFVLYQDGDWYLTEDGKTMGLAPYGTKDRYYSQFRKYLDLRPDGGYELHLKNGGLLDVIEHALDGLDGTERFARAADLAYAAQALIEETLIHVANRLYDDTGLTDLCLAGGVALNCVANGRLLRETPFQNVFVQPAAGDGGCAVGTAYYGYHVVAGNRRDRGPCSPQRPQRHAYLGRRYRDDEIRDALDASGLVYRKVDHPARLAAEALSRSRLIGWFTGGSEFGPRALGHRSILADPRRAEMKDILNDRVKHREAFRPFAPAVLAEAVSDYFELDIESPYMLLVAPVREDKQSVVPAIVHVDGTARVQTVTRAENDRFRELIEWFDDITGVPVVLNTSYNDRGEPIVETPDQALRFFGPSRLDYLFIEDYVAAHSAAELDAAVAPADDWERR